MSLAPSLALPTRRSPICFNLYKHANSVHTIWPRQSESEKNAGAWHQNGYDQLRQHTFEEANRKEMMCGEIEAGYLEPGADPGRKSSVEELASQAAQQHELRDERSPTVGPYGQETTPILLVSDFQNHGLSRTQLRTHPLTGQPFPATLDLRLSTCPYSLNAFANPNPNHTLLSEVVELDGGHSS